jgi:hypothetical protein
MFKNAVRKLHYLYSSFCIAKPIKSSQCEVCRMLEEIKEMIENFSWIPS